MTRQRGCNGCIVNSQSAGARDSYGRGAVGTCGAQGHRALVDHRAAGVSVVAGQGKRAAAGLDQGGGSSAVVGDHTSDRCRVIGISEEFIGTAGDTGGDGASRDDAGSAIEKETTGCEGQSC